VRRHNPDFEGAIWGLVEINVTPCLGEAEKINITVLLATDPYGRTTKCFPNLLSVNVRAVRGKTLVLLSFRRFRAAVTDESGDDKVRWLSV
jgi:hypothetical protein